MNHIFKVISLPPSANPTVGETNFPQHYSGVNTNMAWAEVQPVLRQAAEEWILPFVGEELYADLTNKFIAGTVLTAAQGKTLLYLQDALAAYTIYKIMPQKATAVASLGVVENVGDSSSAARQWTYKEKRLDALATADAALDRAMGYLNKQVDDGVAYFDLYKNSAAYTHKTSVFFKTATDLSDFINLQNSRRTFVSLIPFLRRVERFNIQGVVCETIFADLTNTPTTANAKLLPFITEAVAYLGAAEALPHHRVVVDGDGFRVVSHTDGFDDRRNLTNSVHEQAVGAVLNTYKTRGEAALRRLVAYLEANLSDYPDYANSPCRTQPAEKGHGMVAGDDKIGAIGIF